MERYNFQKTNAGKRTRVVSESASGRKGIAGTRRSRLVSESAAASKDGATSYSSINLGIKALHSHPAPSFSLLLRSSSRVKEERRCVLTASERKQRDIRDPEEFLLRSVLVNNTVRHLNQDLRKEKAAKTAKRAKAVSRVRL